MRRWAAAALAVLLAACAGAPLKPASPARARLAEAESRAAGLVRNGDYAAAARSYGEALRIATSLEDADAIAGNAINLSIVEQWLGHDAEAGAALAPVLEAPGTRFPELRVVQAELRRAILDLAAGNADAAARWAGEAERRCAAIGCSYGATILNVRAQLALQGGRAAEAAELAQMAADRSRGESGRAENANALRMLGRARAALGQYAAALEPLQQALEIDRALADPRKIVADLAELARVSASAGDAQAARGYEERRVAVRRAMSEAKSPAEMEVLLRR